MTPNQCHLPMTMNVKLFIEKHIFFNISVNNWLPLDMWSNIICLKRTTCVYVSIFVYNDGDKSIIWMKWQCVYIEIMPTRYNIVIFQIVYFDIFITFIIVLSWISKSVDIKQNLFKSYSVIWNITVLYVSMQHVAIYLNVTSLN